MTTQELFCDNCGAANPSSARFCQNCAAPLLARFPTGTLPDKTLLNSRYELEKRIGQGGMGAVYKANDTLFNNRAVAIKEMSRAGLPAATITEAEEAFQREANILAGLTHPHLPRIYDNFTEDERSYLVMDFIEGETLEDYLEKRDGKPVPLELALKWGEELCDVLSYLHEQNPPVIFRDLKPANVMIDTREHIFLIDFGIARLFKPGKMHDTVALGSPGFAAPEQYGKSQSSPRSDIYSLGAVLHTLLTGVDPSERPFFFLPTSQLNPEVPRELSDLIQRMLEMTSDQRPASAKEVERRLREIDKQREGGTLTFASAANTKAAAKAQQTSQLLQNAYTLYQQKRVRDAVAAYDRAIQTDNTNPLGWQGRGLTYALNADHGKALASFEEALKRDNKLVTAWNGKGTALSMLGRYREALDSFDSAIQLEYNNADAWNGKGAALSALNQHDQALNAFDLALKFEPQMAQAWSNKGLVLRQLKRYSEALRAFDQALTFNSKVPAYWNGKGLVLYEMGRLRDALQAFQEATHRDNNYAPAWYGIGNVLYAQQVLQGALEAYEHATQSNPRFVKAWDRRGNVLADMGRYSKALDSYDQALRLDSRHASSWNGRANVLCQLERYNQALDAYDKALSINPNAPLAWNGKGNAYYHLGDFQRSLEAYDRAIRLYPNMVSAWYNKSLVLNQLRRYQEALAAAEKAIQLAPDDPDNWQRKAEALGKIPGRRKERRLAEAEVVRLRSGA